MCLCVLDVFYILHKCVDHSALHHNRVPSLLVVQAKTSRFLSSLQGSQLCDLISVFQSTRWSKIEKTKTTLDSESDSSSCPSSDGNISVFLSQHLCRLVSAHLAFVYTASFKIIVHISPKIPGPPFGKRHGNGGNHSPPLFYSKFGLTVILSLTLKLVLDMILWFLHETSWRHWHWEHLLLSLMYTANNLKLCTPGTVNKCSRAAYDASNWLV